MNAKLLTEHHLEFLSLKVGFIFSSKSTLVKMPHCWKSLVVAHLEFLSLKRAAQVGLSLHLSKCYTVGNHMLLLILHRTLGLVLVLLCGYWFHFYTEFHRLAPVLKTIFQQFVISYTCSQTTSDDSAAMCHIIYL